MRIGLIGAGAVADLHIIAARETGRAEITAVCDLDVASADRAVASAPGAKAFTDYRDLYASGLVDAVIVNTPHALHAPMVVDAARAGLHVLVEKPMATTLEDCDRMVEACREAGVALSVGHIQHFLPDKRAAHDLVASGELGAVRMIRDQRSTDYRPGSRSAWFFSPKIAGGGALFNIGGHCIDRTLWFGDGRAVEVSATTAKRFGSEVETDGTVSLRLDNGVGVSMTVLTDPPIKSDRMTVVCEGGVVEIDPRNGAFAQIDGQRRVLHEPGPGDIQSAFTAQMHDFLSTIDGAEPAVPLDHARHVVELVIEAYKSAEQGAARSLLSASPAPSR